MGTHFQLALSTCALPVFAQKLYSNILLKSDECKAKSDRYMAVRELAGEDNAKCLKQTCVGLSASGHHGRRMTADNHKDGRNQEKPK